MLESNSLQQAAPDPPVRRLKIEAVGDSWKGLIKPKIRITGHWLERAGFRPGSHVQITCVAPGVMELRSPNASTLKERKHTASDQPKRSL